MTLTRDSARRWEEAWPRNVHGVARALTEIGPVRMGSWAFLKLRFGFLLRRYCWLYRNRRRRPLQKLGFIHFARWSLIDALPDDDGELQPQRPIYMFFESNFNGGFDEYIDAFSYVIPDVMKGSFGATVGFPGPQPATEFKAFIRERGYEAEHFYSAYPRATAMDLDVALRTYELLQPVLAATNSDQDAFAREWRKFVTEARL